MPTAWDSHMATERMEGWVASCAGNQEGRQLGLGGSDNLSVGHRRALSGRGTHGRERERVLGGSGGTEPQGAVEVLMPSLHCQHQQGCREEHL